MFGSASGRRRVGPDGACMWNAVRSSKARLYSRQCGPAPLNGLGVLRSIAAEGSGIALLRTCPPVSSGSGAVHLYASCESSWQGSLTCLNCVCVCEKEQVNQIWLLLWVVRVGCSWLQGGAD